MTQAEAIFWKQLQGRFTSLTLGVSHAVEHGVALSQCHTQHQPAESQHKRFAQPARKGGGEQDWSLFDEMSGRKILMEAGLL
jgi:hypothetical protein